MFLEYQPLAEEVTAATRTGQHRGESLIDTTGTFNESAVPRYLRILNDFFPAKTLRLSTWLDVGCGHGEFIESLVRYFGSTLRVRGCEPNRGKTASARNRGFDVDFFDLSKHNEKYDCLSLLNVYSHLPGPVETLSEWKSLIDQGGYLLLETGHSCHLSPDDHHKPFYLPDHLSFANQEIVESILVRIGFRILKTKIYRHTVFAPLSAKAVVKEALKLVLGRKSRLSELFPRYPDRDMFILPQRN